MTVERRRIAVVGGGVAGLTAAYVLQQGGCEVSLYEAEDRLGGHAHTHDRASADGRVLRIDTVTAFAGAYHGWGFHEDGCRSGVHAAAALGVRW